MGSRRYWIRYHLDKVFCVFNFSLYVLLLGWECYHLCSASALPGSSRFQSRPHSSYCTDHSGVKSDPPHPPVPSKYSINFNTVIYNNHVCHLNLPDHYIISCLLWSFEQKITQVKQCFGWRNKFVVETVLILEKVFLISIENICQSFSILISICQAVLFHPVDCPEVHRIWNLW
jgi:hypothetical protein